MTLNSLGIDKTPQDTRVVVAMSGGVDSSVVAAMLADEGYEVIGITLQLYDHGEAIRKKGACCAGQDIHDARRVAEQIGIPHYVLNYENRFKDAVMEDFADTYLAGETPIPCVKCNQSVKFKDLLSTARELGADCLATGHYVQRKAGSRAELHKAVDESKDQSYFLFATTQEQLEFLRFPLGGKHKTQTRALAEKYGLLVQDKPDSQDICFVPQGSYAKVVEQLRPGANDPGEIVHLDGRILGEHEGVIHYTVGQRRGLGIGGGEPLYVIRLEPGQRRVIVGPQSALEKGRVVIRDVNWLGEQPLNGAGQQVLIKHRSTTPGVQAQIFAREGGQAEVHFLDTQYGVAPGQACVLYDNERVLGGGWIMREVA